MPVRHLLSGTLVAACLLAVVIATKTNRGAGSGAMETASGVSSSAPSARSTTSGYKMTADKWNELISDRGGRSDSVPDAFRKWLATDFESALMGFRDLARVNPDLARKTCAGLDFIKDGPEVDRILDCARRTLKGEALGMFQAGLANALAGQNPGKALDLFAASGVANDGNQNSFTKIMLESIYLKSSGADPAVVISWVERHKAEKFPANWRAICSGVVQNQGNKPIDEKLLSSMIAAIPQGREFQMENLILLGQNRTEHRLENSRALLQCLPDATSGTEARKREAILATLARYSPELFTGGDFTYEHPHDAYAVGQGRSKTSLESGLAWANAIESPEARDYAIKGVVHGLLEEGSHFTSERISLMSPDDPMRRKAVLAMVEWLEINGMAQEAAPWRDQLSDDPEVGEGP